MTLESLFYIFHERAWKFKLILAKLFITKTRLGNIRRESCSIGLDQNISIGQNSGLIRKNWTSHNLETVIGHVLIDLFKLSY